MLRYDWDGQNEVLKNLWEEITIGEFEKSMEIQEEFQGYEYWLELFNVLGLTRKFVDAIDLNALIELIKDFKKAKKISKEYIPTFDHDGYTYRAYEGGDYKINAREFADMEKLMRRNLNKSVASIMAIIFKREDLSEAEHKASGHLKHKETIFRDNMPMHIALPYIMLIGKKYLENAKIMEDAANWME